MTCASATSISSATLPTVLPPPLIPSSVVGRKFFANLQERMNQQENSLQIRADFVKNIKAINAFIRDEHQQLLQNTTDESGAHHKEIQRGFRDLIRYFAEPTSDNDDDSFVPSEYFFEVYFPGVQLTEELRFFKEELTLYRRSTLCRFAQGKLQEVVMHHEGRGHNFGSIRHLGLTFLQPSNSFALHVLAQTNFKLMSPQSLVQQGVIPFAGVFKKTKTIEKNSQQVYVANPLQASKELSHNLFDRDGSSYGHLCIELFGIFYVVWDVCTLFNFVAATKNSEKAAATLDFFFQNLEPLTENVQTFRMQEPECYDGTKPFDIPHIKMYLSTPCETDYVDYELNLLVKRFIEGVKKSPQEPIDITELDNLIRKSTVRNSKQLDDRVALMHAIIDTNTNKSRKRLTVEILEIALQQWLVKVSELEQTGDEDALQLASAHRWMDQSRDGFFEVKMQDQLNALVDQLEESFDAFTKTEPFTTIFNAKQRAAHIEKAKAGLALLKEAINKEIKVSAELRDTFSSRFTIALGSTTILPELHIFRRLPCRTVQQGLALGKDINIIFVSIDDMHKVSKYLETHGLYDEVNLVNIDELDCFERLSLCTAPFIDDIVSKTNF